MSIVTKIPKKAYVKAACWMILTEYITARTIQNMLIMCYSIGVSTKYISECLRKLNDQGFLKCVSVNMNGEKLYEIIKEKK
jgi:hypothetical protein